MTFKSWVLLGCFLTAPQHSAAVLAKHKQSWVPAVDSLPSCQLTAETPRGHLHVVRFASVRKVSAWRRLGIVTGRGDVPEAQLSDCTLPLCAPPDPHAHPTRSQRGSQLWRRLQIPDIRERAGANRRQRCASTGKSDPPLPCMPHCLARFVCLDVSLCLSNKQWYLYKKKKIGGMFLESRNL